MHEIILCKLGEVVLKGLNRRSFEMKLMSNIRRRTQRFGKWKIYSRQSTIYVEPVEDTCDIAGAYAACKQVFGIIAITRALPCEKSKEAIFDTARTYLGGALTAAKSFKVESKRADKSFPMGSIQLSQWVGGALHDAFPHLTVDVHHPELTVYVEVREDAAYVHGPAEAAAGGLPLGMGGHAVSLLSGGIDSPVSSYMIAKRGVQRPDFPPVRSCRWPWALPAAGAGRTAAPPPRSPTPLCRSRGTGARGSWPPPPAARDAPPESAVFPPAAPGRRPRRAAPSKYPSHRPVSLFDVVLYARRTLRAR